MMNFGYGFGFFGWIFMVLMVFLWVTGIVALVWWLGPKYRRSQGFTKSALEVLKERYAKGEIDKREFEEKKKDLGV